MNTRQFPGAEAVSEIGLGTWQLGGDWGPMDDEEAQAILGASANHGVTFLDTADVYGLGESERRVGRFLQESGLRAFVATKLCRYPEPGGDGNFSLETFRQHTRASLERLGLATLDLTQVHCPPTEVLRDGAVFDWLRALQDEGLIRHWGVSVESMEEAELCLEQDGLASLQIIFNIFRQKPKQTIFEAAKAKGVALIVRLPLASGLLADKFTVTTTFTPQDHRTFNREGDAFNVGETFAGLPFEKGVELAAALRPYVPEGMTMAQFAMRWVLDHDAVTVTIPGATRVVQAAANAAVSDVPPLSTDVHRLLEDFYDTEVAPHIRGKY